MLPDRVIASHKGGYVLIRSQVLSTLNAHAQIGNLPEAGGILLGSYRGEHLDVVSATTPQVSDLRSRFSFTRNRRGHQKKAKNVWSSSRGTITYIGEWHTHPENSPRPSQTDLVSWSEHLPNRPMVLIIQGIEGLYIAVQSTDGTLYQIE